MIYLRLLKNFSNNLSYFVSKKNLNAVDILQLLKYT